MANNDKFRKAFAKKIEQSKGKLGSFVNEFVVEIDKRLVEKSPVDTGRFKANWVLGNGKINSVTLQTTTPTDKAPEIRSIKVDGRIIYITNSLPYAKRLELGWSDQAPAGMVGTTLAEIRSIGNQVGIKIKEVK